jgi:hypothetical protein
MSKRIRWGAGIAVFVALGVVCTALLALSSCGILPPLYIPQPSVLVQYHLPDFAPDGSGLLFVKSVTQQRSKKVYHPDIFIGGNWMDIDVALWTKAYLCSVDRDGVEKKCIMEAPVELLQLTSDPAYYPTVYRIRGFKVSGSQKLAILLTPFGKLTVIDLQKKACRPYDLSSFQGLSPGEYTLDIAPDGKEFVFGSKGDYRGIAICDFKGQIRAFPTEIYPYSVNWNKDNGLILIQFLTRSERYFQIVDPQSMKIVADSRQPDVSSTKAEYRWVRNVRPCWLPDGMFLKGDFSTVRGGDGRTILPGAALYRGVRISRNEAASLW